MTKTDQEKNLEHDVSQALRPKEKFYNFAPLEAVIREWVKGRE